MTAKLTFLGWNEKQWAYVQSQNDRFVSYQCFIDAQLKWLSNTVYEPLQIDEDVQLTAFINHVVWDEMTKLIPDDSVMTA